MNTNSPFFNETEAQHVYHGNNNLLKLYETNIFGALCVIKEQINKQITPPSIAGDNDETYNIKAPARNAILQLKYFDKSKPNQTSENHICQNRELWETNRKLLHDILAFANKRGGYEIDVSQFDNQPRPDIQTIQTLEQFMCYLFHRYVKDVEQFT
jgi:hypothetical protein